MYLMSLGVRAARGAEHRLVFHVIPHSYFVSWGIDQGRVTDKAHLTGYVVAGDTPSVRLLVAGMAAVARSVLAAMLESWHYERVR